MANRYRITHETRYTYSEPVSHCHNLAHLRPLDRTGQRCLDWRFQVFPGPDLVNEHLDFFGNRTTYFEVQTTHTLLHVKAVSEVNVGGEMPPEQDESQMTWEDVRDYLVDSLQGEALEARQYLLESPYVPLSLPCTDYARRSFTPGRPLLDGVEELMHRIYADFTYDPGFTDLATPLEEVLEHRRGVCQDFAHLAIACLRSQGLAAAYVSGYLETQPPPGQEKLVGADASHAWFSVYVPGFGWRDFDPTNDQVPLDQHITTARGRDFSDVTPLKGMLYGGGEPGLHVSVDVARL